MASGPWIVSNREAGTTLVTRLVAERDQQRERLSTVADRPGDEGVRIRIESWLSWCDRELSRLGYPDR